MEYRCTYGIMKELSGNRCSFPEASFIDQWRVRTAYVQCMLCINV